MHQVTEGGILGKNTVQAVRKVLVPSTVTVVLHTLRLEIEVLVFNCFYFQISYQTKLGFLHPHIIGLFVVYIKYNIHPWPHNIAIFLWMSQLQTILLQLLKANTFQKSTHQHAVFVLFIMSQTEQPFYNEMCDVTFLKMFICIIQVLTVVWVFYCNST